jgi:RNA exonuclease 1
VTNTSDLDKIPRTSLLLNISQMLREDYPTEFDTSGAHNYSNYVYTNANYSPVTDESPLFSIDCEMCYNIDGEMEVVWLSLVNESLECVYETFVKPKKKIHNYLTQ